MRRLHTGARLLLVAAACALAACGERAHDTKTLGAARPQASGPAALTDARGNPLPPPPAGPGVVVQAARTQDQEVLAVWTTEQQVVAARWDAVGGWSQPQPLERIHGEANNPRIASNGQGVAMAVWHHRVGNIHSLRFSRYDTTGGWSVPDVLPGALPRPGGAAQDAPQLSMDAQGRVTARWTSGFHANEVQVARYEDGRWSEAATEAPMASAAAATPVP